MSNSATATRSNTPTVSEVRAWAAGKGIAVGARGKLPASVKEAWNKSHRTRQV